MTIVIDILVSSLLMYIYTTKLKMTNLDLRLD